MRIATIHLRFNQQLVRVALSAVSGRSVWNGEPPNLYLYSLSFNSLFAISHFLRQDPRLLFLAVTVAFLCALFWQNVYIAVYTPDCEEAARLEKGRAEWTGGEMVRKSSEESCQKVKEDWTIGRAGKGHYNPERKHEMHHHTEVFCAKTGHLLNLPSGLTTKAILNLSCE